MCEMDSLLDFYGLGGDFLRRTPIPFNFNGKVARIGAAVRIVPDTVLGIRADYADTEVIISSERPILGKLRADVERRGLGPFVTYDRKGCQRASARRATSSGLSTTGYLCGSRTPIIPTAASSRPSVTPKKKRKPETAVFMLVAEAPADLMYS